MPYNPNSPTGDVKVFPRPSPEIEIEIKGNRHNIGKTTIAAIIQKALKNAGIDDIVVNCKYEDIDTVTSENFDNEGIIISNDVKNVKVIINDNNEFQ